MSFQFDMSPGPSSTPAATPPGASEAVDLLRQMLEIQREQLGLLRNIMAAHDAGARWRAFLERWREHFPELAAACREAMPLLERSYGKMIKDLTEYLDENGADALDNDFSLQEFLDRYGMRLTQLGTILNMVAPFADASSPSESA
jgi:hypothetical protein